LARKHPRFTERGQHRPATEVDEARGLEQHRLQGDRVGQVLPVFYQLQKECLTGRRLERVMIPRKRASAIRWGTRTHAGESEQGERQMPARRE